MRETLVVGTAGHIDHGKTSLIRHLTGIDADRLIDEKRRGITIDLGFAYLKINDSQTISFVDVPGHERFIKNMLAGAMGMDAVMIVVAADEGFMPQTFEHIHILSHLNIKKGLVVLTKCDLVDDEELEFRREEIQEFLQDTFLEGAPVIEYSIKSDHSKSVILSALQEMISTIEPEIEHSMSRLSLDRVFSIKGHGTVITGTLIEGRIRTGETLIHYPSKKGIRVKSIQVHNAPVEMAHYGQRVALNLSVDRDDLSRGDVLSSSESIPEANIMDVRIKLDESTLKHWQRVRVYHGTREVLGRVATQGQVELDSSGEHVIQLRLESPLFCKINDPIIIRNFSPLVTLGGGKIINPHAKKHQFSDESLTVEEEVLVLLQQTSQPFNLSVDLLQSLPFPVDVCERALEFLKSSGQLVQLYEDAYVTEDWISSMLQNISSVLISFHNENPLKPGIDRETLRSKLNSQVEKKRQLTKSVYQHVLNKFNALDLLRTDDQWVRDIDHFISFNQAESNWIDACISKIDLNGTKPSSIKEIYTNDLPKKTQEELLYYLINSEILVKINEEVVILKSHYERCRNILLEHFKKHDQISVAEYRDLLDLSRKGSVELLEHFDRVQLTKRMDNSRILLKR